MSSLVITKQTGNFFSLVLDGGEPIISEQNRLTTIGDYCNFKTENGANLILKQRILYSEITIITGVSHVPTSINDLWVSLIDAGYFDGLGTGGGGTATRFDELLDTFTYFGRDGQLLIVDEAGLKLDTVAWLIFTDTDKLKLDGIETGAQVNVQADVNETDPTSDAYIKNFPVIGSYFNDTYDDVLIYLGGTQDLEIPLGVTATSVFLNKAPLYKFTEWTQADNIVTIINTLAVNDELMISGLKIT